MQESWWEKPVCYLCDYWWLWLLLLVAALVAYFTRSYWLPEQIVATPLPTPTVSPSPMPTETIVLGTGDVQATLRWSGFNDIDLHVTDPAGETINFYHAFSLSGGELDVDSNAGCGLNRTQNPVENIFWPAGEAPHGSYQIYVDYYQQCTTTAVTPFEIRLLVDGQVQELSGQVTSVGDHIFITKFER